jgi:hypothetical protein
MAEVGPFKVKPELDRHGGERVVSTDWECEDGCIPGEPGYFWADGTIWIQDPTSDDEWPDGICELISAQNELQVCKIDPNNPKPPEWPIPFPVCDYGIRRIQTISVAVKAPVKESRCFVGEFMPFHRIGIAVENRCSSGKIFVDDTAATAATCPIYEDFVKNFDRRDMSISGPSWLNINNGCLVGEAPILAVETPFDFVVSARNSKGVGSVDLRLIVEPPLPADAPQSVSSD